MNQNEHFVCADSEGYFYCRAVDAFLNVRKEQHVCGRGCPYYTGKAQYADGEFVCRYDDGKGMDEPALFPSVEGLDERLYRAYAYAAKAHLGQYRKKTRIPYFTHIITTMNYALELTQDIEVLQGAILHDTVEDTWVTFDDLKKEFGERVARLVETETENKRRDMPASQTWEIRKQEAIAHLRSGSSLRTRPPILSRSRGNSTVWGLRSGTSSTSRTRQNKSGISGRSGNSLRSFRTRAS